MYLSDDELNTALARLTAARLVLQLVRRQASVPEQLGPLVTAASTSLDDLVPILTRERPRPPMRHAPSIMAWTTWPVRLGRYLLRPLARTARGMVTGLCMRTTEALGRV